MTSNYGIEFLNKASSDMAERYHRRLKLLTNILRRNNISYDNELGEAVFPLMTKNDDPEIFTKLLNSEGYRCEEKLRYLKDILMDHYDIISGEDKTALTLIDDKEFDNIITKSKECIDCIDNDIDEIMINKLGYITKEE